MKYFYLQDIPKIDDKDFSVTLNAFFVVRWTDTRLVIDQARYILASDWPILIT